MPDSALRGLAESLPPGMVVLDPDVLAGYSRDKADLVPSGNPGALVRPTDVEHVRTAVRWANGHGRPVVPRGAGTGLSGGANAIDGCVLISLERMNGIREINPGDMTVVVEPGVINADVTKAVAEHGLFYPPDPGSFEISTIGGNLATNAGGMRCIKYGVTRNSVLGLEVVLPDGRLLRTGGKTIKNVAGFDLTQLFVGSEGSLGIITSAILRLRPSPTEPPSTFVATFDSLEDAGRALDAITASDASPSLLELMDQHTINAVENYKPMGLDRDAAALLIGQADDIGSAVRVERMVDHCAKSGASFVYGTDDPVESKSLLLARRLAGFATMEQGPSVIEDVSVPRSAVTAMLLAIENAAKATEVHIATVGHAGDGNLHPVLMLPDLAPSTRERAWEAADQICVAALQLGGSITGEHGVGELKRRWISDQLDEVSLDIHRRIKAFFDPANIMNPGRGF